MKTKRIFARVSPDEHARYIAMGGSEWLRKALADNQEAEMGKARDAWNGSCDWVAFRDGWMAAAKVGS